MLRMKLAEFFSSERGAQSRLSRATGIPAPMLSQWASGARPVPVPRVLPLERATNGQVTRCDLRPNDWQEIWPGFKPARPAAKKRARVAAAKA
jgi:DNA-binding transcriptional regulator YdaS (Cro superfamily)